jgi:GR25 family glycosyltransferase involved in LPS biosynthesis
MDIKYYVRTTGERDFDYSNEIEYEVLVDKERNPGKHFLDSLKHIKNENAVLMEDDIVLCKDFKREIEKVINKYPDTIINFFPDPFDYFTTHLSDNSRQNQCTYFPKGILKDVIKELEPLLGTGEFRGFYSRHLDYALRQCHISFLKYRPALVQHKDTQTLLTRKRQFRLQTLYYKDYLDELGITMEEAYTKENTEKLKQLLEKDNKKWDAETERRLSCQIN